jgi:hypothetical protein
MRRGLKSQWACQRTVLTKLSYTQLTAGQWVNCKAITLTQMVGSEHYDVEGQVSGTGVPAGR